MAKKKVSRPVSKGLVKSAKKSAAAVKKAPVVKKVAKPAVPAKKTSAKGAASTAVKAPAKQAAPVKGAPVSTPDVALGRPLVTQEEKLYMLFHDDYHSRQVFEFLRVQTVKELEEYSPQQIIHLLSKPIRTTVDLIRQRLAKYKRSLRDDEPFAAEYAKLMAPVGEESARQRAK